MVITFRTKFQYNGTWGHVLFEPKGADDHPHDSTGCTSCGCHYNSKASNNRKEGFTINHESRYPTKEEFISFIRSLGVI